MNSEMLHRRAAVNLIVVCAGVMLVPAVRAQDAELDEIIVTSQKREQSALEVPMTVDVFSADQIEKTGALNLQEMQDFIPGFEVGENPTQASITIRGVSSANISTGGDPSVATFYDDVYVPRAATTITFSDMARVEVLKGPQGTLYGRNAAAGVVNMVPNQPASENEGFVKARVGNYNLMRVEAMGNMALSDSVFVRANVLSNHRDGYLTNVIGGREPGEQDNIAARLSALWQLSEVTQLQLAYDYDRVDNAARGAVGLSEWAECPTDPRCGRVRNDVIDGTEGRDMWAANAKLTHEWNDSWSTRLITGYRTFEVVNRQDEDGTAEFDRYLDTDNIEDSDISYSELQFNFDAERLHVVFGGNFSRENTRQDIPVNMNVDSVMRAVTAGIAADTGFPFDHLWNPGEMAALMSFLLQQPITPDDVIATGDFFYDVLDANLPGVPIVGPSFAGQPWSEYYFNEGTFTNWGIYGDADFTINDRLNVLVGLRYSSDDKTFSWRNPPNTLNAVRPGTDDIVFVAIPGYEQARTSTLVADDDWSKVTGRAVVNYRLNDSALTFLSYSTGYKSGGYDSLDVTTSDNPLRPEESENLELGLKGDFFGERLRAQVSLFDMSITGRQRTVDTLPPGQPNAVPRVITGDQDIQGVEVVLDWLVTDTLRFGFLTTWRDVESSWEPFYNAVGELVTEFSSDATDTDYTVTLDWQPPVASAIDVRLEYIFNENTGALDPGVIDPGQYPGFYEDRKELNARVAWTSEDDRYSAAVWGRNLLDQKLLGGIRDITLFAFGTPFTSMEVPMTWGVEFGMRF